MFAYFFFLNCSPEGKVPCFGLGPTTLRELEGGKGEIQGIYFQKVDTGIVKAAVRVDSFLPLTWEDAPTRPPAPAPAPAGQQAVVRVRNLHNRLDLAQVHADNVRPQWQEFTNAMTLMKNAMLVRVSITSTCHMCHNHTKPVLCGYLEGRPFI